MRLTESLSFSFGSELSEAAALSFVRDVERSLTGANLLAGVQLLPGEPLRLSAHLPVNTPLFGRRELPFVSEVHLTERGAALVPAELAYEGRGWAEVGGEATVEPTATGGSQLSYALVLTIHLDLPDADHWGTRALTKMIELTAGTVLRQLSERLPASVEAAAASVAAELGAA